ncbi:Mediator of RNA polymerase II transcription subunit 7 [Tritrichomonas foetus]|uniref:Mediator of RNA polymerase II transcription subunit 7 n=1 Tax=Tritrichomonas foetus TaxID=1144522 RepID=A0A1J4K0R5_9EUKA|nr:Mediator of RNA polymerase II transcription subunit 7 [Tritrichomonas foetus]|eukprot:OHT04546.1 Mediator of RNA polymerase II transcription subunit 7 [Tritrichomonas foetus]
MNTQGPVAAFPPPPDEYTKYTNENMESFRPPKIPNGPVQVFGESNSFDSSIPPLPENVPILYDEEKPPLFELKRINHQILFTFQKLVGIIATGNESPEQSLNQIKYLFMNAHHLLHRLRAVQGYEHMRRCMEEQNRQLDNFKLQFRDKLDEIKSLKPP